MPKIKSILLIFIIDVALGSPILFSSTTEAKQKTKFKKTIVVGGDFDYRPYTFTDRKGRAKGFDVDLMKYIAEQYDLTLEFQFSPWDEALEKLKMGQVDVLLGILYTEKRDAVYDFTIPHSEEYYSIFVRSGCSIKEISDLANNKIIALEGDASVNRFIKPMGFEKNTVYVNSLPRAINLLSSGACQAVLAPYSIGMETLEKTGIKNIEVTGPPILPSLYRFAVKEGNTDLLTILNDGIDRMKSTGKMKNIRAEWQFHKRNEISFYRVMRYAAIGLIPVFLVIIGLSVWSRILNRKVKEKTQMLSEKNASLEKLNSTKDKLFSVIGHDLRSPFNSILGISDLLLTYQYQHNSDKFDYFLKSMNVTAKNTLNLLDNLLCWARTQTGHVQFQPETINLNDLISQNTSLLTTMANLKNITLHDSHNYDIAIQGDRQMLMTVLRNLVSNAIKFTGPSGEINIQATENQHQVIIEVSDNGMGMDEITRNSLFRMEANPSHKGTEHEEGTGLGLILCKEFVERHGGEIWVESEPGKGSNFIFTIPLLRKTNRYSSIGSAEKNKKHL